VPDPENSYGSRPNGLWQFLRGTKAKGAAFGVLLSAGIGLFLMTFPIGDKLRFASYDLPFAHREDIKPGEVAMVFLDDASHVHLNQKYTEVWNRAFFTKLLQRLTREHAKAVVFDIVFSDALDPKTDADFADAIRENGHVVLAADWTFKYYSGVAGKGVGREFHYAQQSLREAAADDASTQLFPDAGEYVRIYKLGTQEESTKSEAWAAALLVNPDLSTNSELAHSLFWLNYYGPESILPAVSLYRALEDKDAAVPSGYFSNKVVFVGSKLQTHLDSERKDEYSTPYSYRIDNRWMSGVSIHATAFLNLIRGDWLRTFANPMEIGILILMGIVFGGGLIFFRPLPATLIAIASVFPVAYGDYYLFVHHFYWFPWLIPVAAQIPMALVWSVAFNTVQIYVEKQKVEQSLRLYLPARLVKKFASDPTLLRPGAKKQQLTILFSDIASFTSITEGMDPDQLAKLMNAYFQSAVDDCIHFTEGTIVKYIGDAIFAFWNAPDPQDDHPYRAAEAALRFRDQDQHEFNGKKVITRIGLHTGEANVGNFGSTTRVDYTAFGENINLASRMEGLNKYLGTRVLMTGDTYQGIGSRMVTRHLGLFRLKGFAKAVNVYELMDRPENGQKTSDLRQRFDEALQCFSKKDFAAAEAAFRRVLELNPQDGPSHFYLEHIQDHRLDLLPPDWKGEITLKDK